MKEARKNSTMSHSPDAKLTRTAAHAWRHGRPAPGAPDKDGTDGLISETSPVGPIFSNRKQYVGDPIRLARAVSAEILPRRFRNPGSWGDLVGAGPTSHIARRHGS